jgi:hypothetical protein
MNTLAHRSGCITTRPIAPRPTLKLARIAFPSWVLRADNQKTPVAPILTKEEEAAYADNIGDYCSIDGDMKPVGKRTLGEMEQDFIGALSSFYYDERPSMSDAEFATLKEELTWAGSSVAVMDSNEQKFLEASMAFSQGKPILSDTEFDELKTKLKQSNSIVTAQGPRCSVRTKKMYSDASADYLRTTLLNLPAVLFVLGLLFAVDIATNFGLTNLVTLPAPFGAGLVWGLLLPVCYLASTSLTNIGFKDAVVLKADCPNCGTEVTSYYGTILTIAGNRGQNALDCPNCTAGLTMDEYKRVLVVNETPEEKAKRTPPKVVRVVKKKSEDDE